jgi:transketolase
MRAAFVSALVELAEQDPATVLLTADLGFAALEPFAQRFPERFFNVGVSEQNMIGMATGLAEAGYRPYCYSIAPFATLRPLEFIRNGPVLHGLPVRIVGVGGGFEYGHAGPTHHGIDDVGCLRVFPGLRIVAPADAAQTVSAMRATHALPGPAYLRIGKNDRQIVPGLDGAYELGCVQQLRSGSRVALLGMGSICADVVAAADQLLEHGVHPTVAVVADLNPAPVDGLVPILAAHDVVITVEAHSIVGGLGSLVAETIAELGVPCRLVRAGVRAGAGSSPGGSERHLHRVHGLDVSSLVELTRSAVAGTSQSRRERFAGRHAAVHRAQPKTSHV